MNRTKKEIKQRKTMKRSSLHGAFLRCSHDAVDELAFNVIFHKKQSRRSPTSSWN